VAKCRCGADLPADVDSLVDADASDAGKPGWPRFVAIALLVGSAAYWTFGRVTRGATISDAPPIVHEAATGVISRPTPSEPPAVPAAAPQAKAPARELSAEQRAWDAAAKLEASAAADARVAAAPEPPLAVPPAAPAPPDAAPNMALEDMVDRAMPAIVLVETTTGRGSAFFVQHDTLITNVHVVQNDGYVTLRKMDGSSVNARVHTRAPAFDIAVLKVAQPSASQAVLQMGTSRSLKAGQEVIVIGSALGTLQNSVSRGIVSGLRNSGGVTLIQSDAAANPGNSGGPMLDRSGRVVGILTAGYKGQQGLNFAVAIDHARDILEGRQANLGSSQAGLANLAPMVPGGQQRPEADLRQQQGEQEFSQRIGAAETAANQLDGAWTQFRSGCYKSPIRGSYDREWFAVFAPGAIPGDAAAGCLDYYQQMTAEMNKFRAFMRQTVEAARRAGVLPGTARDTMRSKRLQSDAWDR
jgi:S1-C subfamily serine protease